MARRFRPSWDCAIPSWVAAAFELRPTPFSVINMEIPTISDDALQCVIFPTKDVDLAVLLTQVMSYTTSLIPNHIWHRDSFQLILSKEQESALECTMRVGDSVDDEWLIVSLLWQVTKRFEVAVR